MKMKLSVLLLMFGLTGVTLSQAQTTATPTISLATGTYVMPQNTTITDSTSGASILWCYVSSGTCTPTTNYTKTIYVDPATTETICANAQASGDSESATACNSYTNGMPTPVISLASGAYVMPQNTTITDSVSGASILWCYVSSGTCTPATNYTKTIYVDPATTEAICANAQVSGGSKSATVCNSYTNETPAARPVISLASGMYAMPQNITITDSTSGASILWCQVASGTCTPATSYSGPISVDPTSTEAICTYATASGYTNSATTCNSYTSSGVTFTPAAGTVASGTTVAIACVSGTPFYTLDGSTPSIAAAEYTKPISITSTTTINAICANNGTTSQNVNLSSSGWKCNTVNGGTYGDLTCKDVGDDGGIGTLPVSNASWSFGTTMNLSISTTQDTSETQNLFVYSGPGCDSCTAMAEDKLVEPTTSDASQANVEIDMSQFDATTQILHMFGLQCNQQPGNPAYGHWQIDNEQTPWVTTPVTQDCPLPTTSYTHVVYTGHWIIGDTGCGGYGCTYYDSLTINGTLYNLSTQSYNSSFPLGTLESDTKDWSSYCGNQDQIDLTNVDESGNTPTVGPRNIQLDNVSCGTYQTNPSGSATYTVN